MCHTCSIYGSAERWQWSITGTGDDGVKSAPALASVTSASLEGRTVQECPGIAAIGEHGAAHHLLLLIEKLLLGTPLRQGL